MINITEKLNDNNHFSFFYKEKIPSIRIDKYLNKYLNNISRNIIQNNIKKGNILVNNKKVKINYNIKLFDKIEIFIDSFKESINIIPENIPLNIIFEDDDIVIINKPAGMVVHPGHGNKKGTLVNALKYHFGELPSLNDDINRQGLVHRIDKNTSGLLIIAKNKYSLQHLANQFFQHTISRKYLAIVWGDLIKDKGTIIGNISRNINNYKQMIVLPNGNGGKHAITHYKVLERFKHMTYISCKLETGRTHQIRTHFKYLGHPIFNDYEYGGNKILNIFNVSNYKKFIKNCFNELPRQALHAISIGFRHPINNNFYYFQSPIPNDINSILKKLRKYKI